MFIFKNISSRDMGVWAEEEDFYKKAPLKYSEEVVEGMDGSVYVMDGVRSDIVSSFNIFLTKDNLDDVMEWLDGKGIFEFNGRKVEMMIYDVVEPLRSSNIYTATVNYIRRPIWYDANDYFMQCFDSVQNQGTADVCPLLRLTGTGIVDLTIGDVRFSYDFGQDHDVYIDCLEKTEYLDSASKSRHIKIGFEYPKLKRGTNKIIIHSGKADVYIKRRNGWL